MNISRTATLVAIFIKCVTASTDLMSQFCKAVDERNVDAAVRFYPSFRGENSERLNMLNYVLDTKDHEFIFRFIAWAHNDGGKEDVLVALHRKKLPKMIEEAFKVLGISPSELGRAVSELELICHPDDFFNFLDKVENQKDQEVVIRGSVYNLPPQRIECLDTFLEALEVNASFKHLKDVAIKQAFRSGPSHDNKLIVERFHDYHAVTSDDYAQGLINSGDRSTQNPIFIFLLGEADRDDLNAVKEHWQYKSSSHEFKKAIDNALLTAQPGGTRFIRRDPQRAELVMDIFKNDSSMRIPTVISQLIASYLIHESTVKPRTTPVKQTIGYKRKKRDDSANKNSWSAHKHAKKTKKQRHPTRQ